MSLDKALRNLQIALGFLILAGVAQVVIAVMRLVELAYR